MNADSENWGPCRILATSQTENRRHENSARWHSATSTRGHVATSTDRPRPDRRGGSSRRPLLDRQGPCSESGVLIVEPSDTGLLKEASRFGRVQRYRSVFGAEGWGASPSERSFLPTGPNTFVTWPWNRDRTPSSSMLRLNPWFANSSAYLLAKHSVEQGNKRVTAESRSVAAENLRDSQEVQTHIVLARVLLLSHRRSE